jgi:uncharacterized membrane protein (DUF2068 family)
MKKMKLFILFSWMSAVLAVVLIVCGMIDFVQGGGLFGLKHSTSFFTVANTTLLVTILFRMIGKDSAKI